jgi:proteic killer suppression protein
VPGVRRPELVRWHLDDRGRLWSKAPAWSWQEPDTPDCSATSPRLDAGRPASYPCEVPRWKNKGTEDLFDGVNSRHARSLLPHGLLRVAQRKLSLVAAAATLDALRVPPSNHLEALRGGREGEYSIRINDQYRICFTWNGSAEEIEVVDYH